MECRYNVYKTEPRVVYLVAIIDWYSRYILSWRISISLESEFCVTALEDAIEKYGMPKIFNTAQGVQFTSENFISMLKLHNGTVAR
ncbi:DDE-type integrase/transposase/recombinase [Candidatus Tisiphia endosymbiont of Sialis lutaria]|uniref:DDE-type integrase/transposase/recombinase n=1 Tax=Candidatus Tisiphia endosymbiont of Sialis lutaria TaxID=2029164 RepID=UPI00312C7E0A